MNFSLEETKKRTSIMNKPTLNETRLSLSKLKTNLQESKSQNMELKLQEYTKTYLPEASKMMKEMKSELVFIFDKSGSCMGMEKATCDNFNKMIQKEKTEFLNTTVTTVLFNQVSTTVHDRLNVNDVKKLHYLAGGGTALYDTLMNVLTSVYQRQSKEMIKPNTTLVVIMTDGYDTDSRFSNIVDVQREINFLRQKGWEFIFLGADLDAKKIASELGMDPNKAEIYTSSIQGITCNFKAVEIALNSLREQGKITSDWSQPIKENNANTNKNIKQIEEKPNKNYLRLEKK